jgi:predicted DNA-binding transcriptional regulator AlpA
MPAAKPSASRRVMPFREWCELNSISEDTGQRLVARGDGPKLTKLSARRLGVREDHNAEWQDRRIRDRT